MANFKPEVTYQSKESVDEYWRGNRKSPHIRLRFDTYAKLRRELKEMLESSDDNTVIVFRSRRGEWGEWFENWSLVNGKPKIVKQGWM